MTQTLERSATADCLSTSQCERLIAGELDDDRRSQATAHLDDCETCRELLERVAADEQDWSAARSLNQRDTAEIARAEIITRTIMEREVLEASPPPASEECPIAGFPVALGAYEVQDVLGHGGMGFVYRAWDPRLQRAVAIKLVSPAIASHSRSKERFLREARAAAAILDPNVVAIHAIEKWSDRLFLVMELVEGETLEERVAAGEKLTEAELTRFALDAAAGLQAAHAAGVIHRDMKPSNLMIDRRSGRIKICDFGLALAAGENAVSVDGCVRGTPSFLSPEQARGETIDPRSDLFSLGCVLYYAATKTTPFHADTPLAALRRTCDDSPQALRELRADLSPEFVAIVERLLEKSPEHRFASAADVSEAIRGCGVSSIAPRVSKRSVSRSFAAWLLGTAALALLISLPVGFHFGPSLLTFAAVPPNGPSDNDGSESATQQPNESTEQATAFAQAPEKKEEADVPKQAPAGEAKPLQIQIVSPDALRNERLRTEKDQIELPKHRRFVKQFIGHEGPVTGLAFTPDGKTLVSCSGWPVGDRTIRMWDVATAKEIRRCDTAAMPKLLGDSGQREAVGEIFTISLTPDGKQIISGATGGTVCVWETATGKLVRTFEKHTATVYASAMHPQGDRAFTGDRAGKVRLWDIATGEERLVLNAHTSWVRGIAVSPDGRFALTGGVDRHMRLWDLKKASMAHEFPAFPVFVYGTAFAPSGSEAACIHGPNISVWDLEKKTVRRTMSNPADLNSIAYTPDGRSLLVTGYNGEVRLWNHATGELEETYTGHRDWTWTTAFTPDGKQFASGGGGRQTSVSGTTAGVDCAIRLWNLPEQKTLEVGIGK